MNEKTNSRDETLFDAVRDFLESGALMVDELIESIKPSEVECRQARRKFWELNAKIASGVAGLAERRLREMEEPAPQRHADRIVVEDDQ